MESRQYAPGGKVSQSGLQAIRAARVAKEALASRLDLSERHVERIVQRQHWATGWLPPRLPDAHRKCVECKATFSRRMANGRLRAPKIWGRMVCCGNTCNLKRAWRLGKFDERGK